MASGTLERCSLHGWIPVFTVQGRWQTACMVSCGWVVCWCQRCGSSGPWWRWGYGMGRLMLWTTNTGAFYWWHFECTEIPWWDPEAHCFCHSSTTITSCCSMIMYKDLYTIPGSWKHPSSCMASILTAIEEEWTNIPQATVNNLINSMQRRCVALCEANGGHIRYWLVFGPPGAPNTVKLHILEWPFLVASLRHTCAIIMLSNQHLDMPHLWGGWIISAKEKCSLTQI